MGAGGGSADSHVFRKRILNLDEATLQDHGVLPAEGGLLQSGGKKGKEKPARRGGGGQRGGRRRPGSGGGERSEKREAASGGEREESTQWNKVPFSWVVRGRQERHLIDQQVTFKFSSAYAFIG